MSDFSQGDEARRGEQTGRLQEAKKKTPKEHSARCTRGRLLAQCLSFTVRNRPPVTDIVQTHRHSVTRAGFYRDQNFLVMTASYGGTKSSLQYPTRIADTTINAIKINISAEFADKTEGKSAASSTS